MAINTEQTPNQSIRHATKKHRILQNVVRGENRPAKRETILPFANTLKAQPKVDFKEAKILSPIPKGKPDKPAVAPCLEYSGFSKYTTKQY